VTTERVLAAFQLNQGGRRRRGSLTGAAARDHDEAEAERLIIGAAGLLGIDPDQGNLSGRGHLLDEKALLAWLVRSHTGVSNVWVAGRLGTGHPTGVSKAVRRVVESRKLSRQARSLTRELLPDG